LSQIFQRHFKNRKRTKRFTGKTVGCGVTREDIKNMLEEFKTDILSSLSSHLDTLQMNKKKEETK
jgi:hypothetical protein